MHETEKPLNSRCAKEKKSRRFGHLHARFILITELEWLKLPLLSKSYCFRRRIQLMHQTCLKW